MPRAQAPRLQWFLTACRTWLSQPADDCAAAANAPIVDSARWPLRFQLQRECTDSSTHCWQSVLDIGSLSSLKGGQNGPINHMFTLMNHCSVMAAVTVRDGWHETCMPFCICTSAWNSACRLMSVHISRLASANHSETTLWPRLSPLLRTCVRHARVGHAHQCILPHTVR